MLRILIVFALLLPSLADVQARGFRLSVRPRAVSLATRPAFHPAETPPSSSKRVFYSRDREGPAQPASPRSVLDQPASQVAIVGAGANAAPVANPPVMKSIDRTAHWCDNGAIVGSGVGFCVLKVSAADPS